MVVTPSDALVIDTGEFRRVVEKALRFTDDSSAIVTIGIRPTRAETGYGYIAAADQLQTDKEIFTVDAFKEKPDKETAEKYLGRQLLLECGNLCMECAYYYFRDACICSGDSTDF